MGRVALALGLVALLLALGAREAQAHLAYVANEGSDSVSVIDTESEAAVGAPIGVGHRPEAIAATPDGSRVYVTNNGSDSVSVIDTATGSVIATVSLPVGSSPRGVAVSPDGKRVYVAEEGPDSVAVIDTESSAVLGDPIEVGSNPEGIAVNPDGRRAYVADNGSKALSVIDTESRELIGDPIPLDPDFGPVGVAVSPGGSRVYVTNTGAENVSVVDTATDSVIGTVQVGYEPVGVAVSPDGRRAYVANHGHAGLDEPGTVSVIDTASDEVLGDPIEVGSGIWGIAVSPDGRRAYVASGSAASVAAIDTESDEAFGDPIEVGSNPFGIAIAPDQPPLAALDPAAGTAGEPIHFDASGSTDPDGEIARYDWSFGDGETATDAGPTPSHTYSAPGTYQVTVTLTDSEGCSTGIVFTGLTASCNGSALASATRPVEVTAKAEPPQDEPAPQPPSSPSNAFRLGKLHRDKQRGTAKLDVSVPGPGLLQLRGESVRAMKRTVGRAGTLTLVVRPKRSEMKTLLQAGRLEVGINVTFRPDGGSAGTREKQLVLVKSPAHPHRSHRGR